MKKEKRQGVSIKKILLLLLWVVVGSGFFILLGAAIKKQNNKVCKSVKIKIDRSNGMDFVPEKEIQKIIQSDEKKLIGRTIENIDFSSMEKEIEINHFVENAEIFMDVAGGMSIEVFQKEPIVRVINKDGVDFYIDKNGNKLPTTTNFTARVIIATGNISDNNISEGKIDSLPTVKKIFVLAKYLREDEFWNSMIQQIYVNEENEFELIPRMGNYSVLIGDVNDLEEKFRKLFIFYKEGLNNVGWGNYEQINLKYKDQVVCKKF